MVGRRFYKLDNIRFILIFLVIFGHCLELIPDLWAQYVYRVIYTFHMPAFVFLSGYFAKYRREKVLSAFFYPYILFQIIYQLFDQWVINPNPNFRLQFAYPYWLLWYLLVVMFYYLLIPLLDDERTSIQILAVSSSIIVSLLVGYDSTMEYFLSISKFFTFFPYFLVGYYLGKKKRIQNFFAVNIKCPLWIGLLSFGSICLICFYLWNDPTITSVMLHGGNCYERVNSNPLIKGLLLIIASCWITFLLLLPIGKRIPFLTILGQNTFSVFLLHGFVIKLAQKYCIFRFNLIGNLLVAVCLTVFVIVLFGNLYSALVFKQIFTGKWMSAIANRLRN